MKKVTVGIVVMLLLGLVAASSFAREENKAYDSSQAQKLEAFELNPPANLEKIYIPSECDKIREEVKKNKNGFYYGKVKWFQTHAAASMSNSNATSTYGNEVNCLFALDTCGAQGKVFPPASVADEVALQSKSVCDTVRDGFVGDKKITIWYDGIGPLPDTLLLLHVYGARIAE